MAKPKPQSRKRAVRKAPAADRKTSKASPRDHAPAPQRTRKTIQSAAAATGGPQLIYLLSDSTGNLARHMVTAFLTQFPRDAFRLAAMPFLQDKSTLEKALDQVVSRPGIVFHALVARDAKQMVNDRCAMAKIPACDLTGNFVDFLSRESGIPAGQDHRRLHDVDEVYHRRIKAIEFALQHDDGLGLETLGDADIVLAGVSRTSKTPTTIYLAQQGYRVGNYAMAMQVPVPQQLLAVDPKKVVGLYIDPSYLVEIRTRRQQEWGMADTRYNDPDQVEREIKWSRTIFAQQGWRMLDVTNRAIEETAARILGLLGISKPSSD